MHRYSPSPGDRDSGGICVVKWSLDVILLCCSRQYSCWTWQCWKEGIWRQKMLMVSRRSYYNKLQHVHNCLPRIATWSVQISTHCVIALASCLIHCIILWSAITYQAH